jgi:uncharacterized protein with PIN domain
MSYDCQLCQNTPIPEKVYELLDWEAAAADELIICPKCMSGLIRNKEAHVEVRLERKSAILVKVLWNKAEVGDEEPGSVPDHLADENPDEE